MTPGGPMPDRFDVDPADLDALAVVFSRQAEGIGDAVPPFESRAAQTDDAFGLLGPSSDVEQEYLNTIPDAAQALYDLSAALEATAAGLQASAENYRQAERDSTMPPGP